jgi:hypothetical protein
MAFQHRLHKFCGRILQRRYLLQHPYAAWNDGPPQHGLQAIEVALSL